MLFWKWVLEVRNGHHSYTILYLDYGLSSLSGGYVSWLFKDSKNYINQLCVGYSACASTNFADTSRVFSFVDEYVYSTGVNHQVIAAEQFACACGKGFTTKIDGSCTISGANSHQPLEFAKVVINCQDNSNNAADSDWWDNSKCTTPSATPTFLASTPPVSQGQKQV